MDSSARDLVFPTLGRRPVVCRFDGGEVTSDAGLLLLAQADRKIGMTEQLAAEIVDRREAGKIGHTVLDLLRERIYAVAQGYEDANDLDRLNTDPALLTACGRQIGSGERLASQPTLSRLENRVDTKDLFCLGMALAELVIGRLPSNTKSVILDVDATEDPCHGQQELEFFNGYYDSHCYVPLYLHVTADGDRQRLLCALLRPGNASSKVGLFGMVRRAVDLLRARFPEVAITLRADSGFGHADTLSFCEAEHLAYILGLGTNARLRALSAFLEEEVLAESGERGEDVRRFGSFSYQADTWEHPRRVACKVETVGGKLNVRYVVTDTTLPAEAAYLFYCQRGDQENRIKEMKLDLASGRTSCHRFLANQFRLLLHAAACVLLSVLQDAVGGTRLANAQVGRLRLWLLKVGGRVKASCRKVWFHLPTSCPLQDVWWLVHQRLANQTT